MKYLFSLIAFLLLGLVANAKNPMISLVTKGKDAALSTDYNGRPFTSMVIYALDEHGTPILFISDMAQHTHNLAKNNKASLMVSKLNKEDVFNSSRLTYVGTFEKVPDKEREAVQKLYLAKHPDAEIMTQLDDFNFYRMKIEKIYYIGGFGEVGWIEIKDYRKHFK